MNSGKRRLCKNCSHFLKLSTNLKVSLEICANNANYSICKSWYFDFISLRYFVNIFTCHIFVVLQFSNVKMKIGKFLLYSLTGGSGIYVGQKVYRDGRLDSNNFGIIRFGRAALAVGRIGVDYKMSLFSSSSPHYGTNEYEELKTEVHQRSAEKLLGLCNKNGGCFIKVGQHIGALDYLLPEEYVSTMKVLHSKAPKMDLEDIYSVLEEDLGKDPKEIFAEFDEEPLGTASLAQVNQQAEH